MSLPGLADPARRTSAPSRRAVAALGRAVLRQLGSRIAAGRLSVATPEGEILEFAGATPGLAASIVLRRWRALPRFLAGGDMGFARSYIDGDWETPDLATLIELVVRNAESLGRASFAVLPVRLLNRLQHLRRRNTRRTSRRNIAAHYDLGNDFYAAWLDPGMSYSSGIYAPGCDSLEAAQETKNARVVELLGLGGARRVLEIGCGWGGLAEKLAAEHDCEVTGVTLSTEQLAYATERMRRAGVDDRVSLRLQDYRDVPGEFDRVVSIEMLEAVGEEHWPRYFAVLRDRLVAGGLAVLQVITIRDENFEQYRRGADFIQRYIFPGGMLPSPTVMRREIAAAGLELLSVETFGAGYARTLADWHVRFRAALPRLSAAGMPPRFARMWSYYLAYCEAGFRAASIDVGLYRLAKPA
jgi:cyclopropane-fatty-acyl-phospholipid synthase